MCKKLVDQFPVYEGVRIRARNHGPHERGAYANLDPVHDADKIALGHAFLKQNISDMILAAEGQGCTSRGHVRQTLDLAEELNVISKAEKRGVYTQTEGVAPARDDVTPASPAFLDDTLGLLQGKIRPAKNLQNERITRIFGPSAVNFIGV